MAMLLLVTVVGLALSALLVPIIINQDHTTRFDATRVHSLSAAQTGIDVVLGKFRSSIGSTGLGDDAKLPCGPISGNAVGNGNESYYVEILYFIKDPIVNPAAVPMICAPGNGPYDPSTTPPTRTPNYACLISTGIDEATPQPTAAGNVNKTSCVNAVGSYGTGANSASIGRTLVTTYAFKTDNTNFAGGVIRIFPAAGTDYCMDAGAASPPPALTPVTLQACSGSTPPASRQVFAYRSDLSIQLVSTASTTSSGLCLDANTPHVAGNALYLNTCSALGSAQPDQQWSIDDNSHLEGANSTGTDIDGFCVNAAGQAPGIALTLQGCTGSTTDTFQTWLPAPSAGAGMAGAPNQQLVNFFQFANCLDVTGQDVNSTFLIAYTCKQNPNPAKVTWNQKFTANPLLGADATSRPASVQYVTTYLLSRYCLTSPGVAGGYPIVQSGAGACPASPVPGGASTWTVYRTKDASLNDLPYDQKYVIKDSSGLCLGLGPNNDLYISQYLKVIVATCDGSASQKWNADPSTGKSALQNTRER